MIDLKAVFLEKVSSGRGRGHVSSAIEVQRRFWKGSIDGLQPAASTDNIGK